MSTPSSVTSPTGNVDGASWPICARISSGSTRPWSRSSRRRVRKSRVRWPRAAGLPWLLFSGRLETPPGAVVSGVGGELAVVFRNLLENAVKYSDDPVKVNVSVAPSGDGRVAVEISDRGIGIPSGELRKIFQRFYRAGRDVQRTAGLGLGLFIVRNLVRRQGGRVVARSGGAGEGSRFVVTLRAAPDSS